MAPEPLNEPEVAVFPVAKLAPLLRAVADPQGTGTLSSEQESAIAQIEENVSKDELPGTDA